MSVIIAFFHRTVQQIQIWQLCLLFLLLMLPTVFAPFHSDDFFHLLLLTDDTLLKRSTDATLFGLFSFVDGDVENRAQLLQYGVLPWWTSESFYFRFWRPLTEVSHWLDVQLWPRSALWAHIHSIIWFLALIWPLSLLIKQSLNAPRVLLLLAIAVFVLDGQHVMTVSWIANRNALLAAFFALWALYFHMRSSDKALFFSPAAWLAYLLSLACGEIALSILAYLFFYTLLLDRRPRRLRILTLLPYLCISVLYLYAYQRLGYGAYTTSTFYINPMVEPLGFVFNALERMAVYSLAAFLPVMAGSSWVGGEAYPWLRQVVLLASGLFILALCYWGVTKRQYFKQNPVLSFWLLSGIFSILPVCCTLPQDRLTLFQTIGIDIAIAIIIYQGLFSGKPAAGFSSAVAKTLLVVHLILSPLHLLAGSLFIHLESQRLQNHALAFTQGKNLTDNRVFIFNLPMGQASTLMGIRRALSASVPDSVFIAAGVEAKLNVLRLSEHQLRLNRQPGFVLGHEGAFRSIDAQPFVEGEVLVMQGMQLQVESVSDQGAAEQVLLSFEESIDSGVWVFYALNKSGDLQEVFLSQKSTEVQYEF